MRKILVSVVALFFVLTSHAQSSSSHSTDYRTALGVKIWDGGGISLKHFFDKNAGELIGYFWYRGVRFTGLYEIHFDIAGAPGLKWYVGPGAHVGFYNDKYGGGAVAGIDGVLGLDYKINNAPINLSLDWQPSLEFGNGTGFWGGWGGLGIRYTF